MAIAFEKTTVSPLRLATQTKSSTNAVLDVRGAVPTRVQAAYLILDVVFRNANVLLKMDLFGITMDDV